MTPTPSFEREISAQVQLALAQHRDATAMGDASAAELALARLADLREVLDRHHDRLLLPA